jgi:hypothetical protein
MKIQVRGLAIALALAVPIAVAATTNSSAAPINGTSIKAAVPAVTTDVRYRVRRGYPTYNSYYPAYVRIGAIRPITIPASLTAGSDHGWW